MTPDNTPAAAPTSSAEAQLQQMRETVAKQVAELKQQITIIQQQSLKAMQETIDSFFKNQIG